jgi:CHAT domain-containing protein/Tfp pilus assembly protein PilF
MSRESWTHKLSINFSRETGWRPALSLAFSLLLVAGVRVSSVRADADLAPAQAQNQDGLAARRKFDEGEALRAQGKAESLRLALKKYEEALPLMRAVGARDGEATTLHNIGYVYKLLGEDQKALDFYNQALPIYRAIGDRRGEAATLNNIGFVYNSLGDRRKAVDFYYQALPLLRAIGDRRGEATTLYNVGQAYKSLDEKQKALDFYNRALALARALGDRSGEALTLNDIGFVYESVGEIQEALDSFTKALPIYRAAGDRYGEALTLNNIGFIYNSLGERRKALDLYNQALPLARELGDRYGEARTLNNIASIYNTLGEKQKALDFLTQALPLHRAIGDRSGEATILANIGAVYKSLGEKQKALDFYAQALPLHRAVGSRGGEATLLTYIGAVYNLQGENQKALELFTQALSLQRAIGDRQGEATTLYGIAITERDLGHFDESRSHLESALKIIESIRAKVEINDLRASYFATEQGNYEFYVDLLMRMHSREPAKGHDAAALQAGERSRARSLLESLTEARIDIRRGADPQLLDQERSLQRRLNAKAEEALKLSASGADKTRLAAHRREIDALTIELQQVQTQILRTSSRYGALTQPQPLTLAEIQRQALDDDTLLLEYSLGKERSYLWAVTPTSINSYELPKREEIEAAAKRVYKLLSKAPGSRSQTARPGDSGLKEAGGQYLEEAAGLSRTLLGPVAGQLAKKRLLIVADGMLHYVPFGALPDPNSLKEGDGSWRPLLVEREIVNLPSASMIAVLRRELAGRKPAAKTLAVLADPVFSRDDERIRPAARNAAQQTARLDPLEESAARKLVQIAGGAPDDSRELRIKRLPFTRMEAEAIAALAPAGSGMKALDFEANRATAMSDQLSQYRYLHFATHGLADSERPELSTIVLSLYDKQGRPQDGFLRAHEVYNLELPAELVTLSACETGLGKLTRGEGLVGLTRGFMYAGAARVVVSLWSVSDRATAELMTKFYRRMLVGGERPAAALRAAQVEMWRDKRWEAPYYWAAFTLQGEWR